MHLKMIFIMHISFLKIYSEYIANAYGSIQKGYINPMENGQKFLNKYFKKRISKNQER